MRRILAVAPSLRPPSQSGSTPEDSVHAVPIGFADVLVTGSVANPLASLTAITPMPDGRALILEKAVRFESCWRTARCPTPTLVLTVCTNSEEGLLGAPSIRTSPRTASYVPPRPNGANCARTRRERVSRFTMTGNTISPASEFVLLDNMAIPAGNHNGGDLHIGADGNLYVSVGDGGANPRGFPDTAAEDLSLLNGKILRITLAGGVPADNPLVGQPGAVSCKTAGTSMPMATAKCTEIYDYGLRNPFRIAFNPNTGNSQFFINDVGEGTWEEVNLGGRGLNYGWNNREGFCNTGSTTVCPPTPVGFTDPLTAYPHSSGCTFITAGAFVPKGVWPPQYDDSYLFADGGCGKMFLRTPPAQSTTRIRCADQRHDRRHGFHDHRRLSGACVRDELRESDPQDHVHAGSSASDFVALSPASWPIRGPDKPRSTACSKALEPSPVARPGVDRWWTRWSAGRRRCRFVERDDQEQRGSRIRHRFPVRRAAADDLELELHGRLDRAERSCQQDRNRRQGVHLRECCDGCRGGCRRLLPAGDQPRLDHAGAGARHPAGPRNRRRVAAGWRSAGCRFDHDPGHRRPSRHTDEHSRSGVERHRDGGRGCRICHGVPVRRRPAVGVEHQRRPGRNCRE